MDSKYDHKLYEDEIYKTWEESGAFKAREKGEPYTILMPPPNANASLHAGHAMYTVDDVMIRFKRMQGFSALWIPGMDHAGFETQYVYEKNLAKEGKSRMDFDRETLYKNIFEFVKNNSGLIFQQFKRLGFSADWDRSVFSLDKKVTDQVFETFKKMESEGLVYRDGYIVNYCTHCGTSLAELEVVHETKIEPLYYIKYGPLTLATVRPETKFGDTALAVNPKDKRYSKWVGKEIEIEGLLGKTKIKVISDSYVDKDFGTGVVKITPAHDPNDFAVWQRHKDEIEGPISVIDMFGRLTDITGKYSGMKVNMARELVVKDLDEKGLIEKIDKNYEHNVTVCYKCKHTLEPLIIPNWFIKVKDLKAKVKEVVENDEVKFFPKKFKRHMLSWLDVMHDWPISRQIVWGIRIPAWRCEKCMEWTITAGDIPETCHSCGNAKLTQDADTFDTWFSSGQWPYATLQASQKGDFDYFYPTTVMETGYDILPFWVLRMLMLGIYTTGEVPFKKVLLHGLVRDKEGQKISKSKGNVIDPLEMAERYGADAVRMSLVWGTLIENDISLSEDNIRGQRNFANKLWNIARFVLSQECTGEIKENLKDEFDALITDVTRDIEEFRVYIAAEKIYHYLWHRFADEIIEESKGKAEYGATLYYILENSLKLLHPFMPFITEEIYQSLPTKDAKFLMVASWPVLE